MTENKVTLVSYEKMWRRLGNVGVDPSSSLGTDILLLAGSTMRAEGVVGKVMIALLRNVSPSSAIDRNVARAKSPRIFTILVDRCEKRFIKDMIVFHEEIMESIKERVGGNGDEEYPF